MSWLRYAVSATKITMIKRREFPKLVRVEILQRAKVATGFRCEKCGAVVASGEVDHSKADGLEIDKTRKLTADDGQFLCIPCHREKTRNDVAMIAKAKRVEARHVGAAKPKQQIRSAGFGPRKERADKIGLPPRRSIFEDVP